MLPHESSNNVWTIGDIDIEAVWVFGTRFIYGGFEVGEEIPDR